MFREEDPDVKRQSLAPRPEMAPAADGAAGRTSGDEPGLIEKAFLTVGFKECAKEYIGGMFCGATQAGFRPTNSCNLETLKAYDPQVFKFVLTGGFQSRKGKPGEFVNGPMYDIPKLLFDKNGQPRAFDPARYGTGVTQDAVTLATTIGFEVDDGPDGLPVPTREQARQIDILVRICGFPVPNAVCMSGDDRPWVVREIERTGLICQPGKSIHAILSLRPTTDLAAREEAAHAVAVVTGGDIAVCDLGHRFRLGGIIARFDGDEDVGCCRVQTALHIHNTPTTIEQVMGACERWASDNGINLVGAFEARKAASALMGGVTRFKNMAKEARLRNDEATAIQALTLAEECEALSEALRRSLKINPRVRELQGMAASGLLAPRVAAPPPEVDAASVTVNSRPAIASDFGEIFFGVKVSGFTAVATANGARTAGAWALGSQVWQVKKRGKVYENTFSRLYQELADKKTGLLKDVACRYHGQDPNVPGSTPAGFMGFNRDKTAAFFQCRRCGCKHWSYDDSPDSDNKNRTFESGDGSGYINGRKELVSRYLYKPKLKALLKELRGNALIEEFNGKRMPPLVLRRKLVLVKAPYGSGKTEQVARFAKKNPDAPMLFIVPTQSLAQTAFGRLKKFGFKLYMDEDGGNLDCPRLVICIDSVPRISWSMNYRLVVVDEGEKTLGRFNDAKMRLRAEVWGRLGELVQSADHAVFMDADLSVATLHIGRMLTGNADVQFIYGTQVRGGTISLYRRIENLEVARRATDGPTFVYANTLADAETTFKLLGLERSGPGLLVGSPTTGEQAVRDLMADPNQRVQGYEFVVASPSMNTGISIDCDHFLHQFAFARAGNYTTAEGVVQGIYRLRDCDDRHLWIDDRAVGTSEDPDYYRARLTLQAEKEIRRAITEAVSMDFQMLRIFGPRAIDTNLVEARIELYVAQARSHNHLLANILGILKEEGVVIVRGKAASRSTRSKAKASFKSTKKAMYAEEFRAIADADIISIVEARRLERKHKATRVERRQVARARIAHVVGNDVTITPAIVEGFVRGKLRDQVFRFTGVQAILDGQGSALASTRLDAYDTDPTRAEDSYLRMCNALARVLREIYGVTSLLALRLVEAPDDQAIENLAALALDRDVGGVLRLRKDACRSPLRLLGDLTRQCGLQGKAIRKKVDGKARYVGYEFDRGTFELMTMLTAHQRKKLTPWVDINWGDWQGRTEPLPQELGRLEPAE
jgi:hypothetical protein